MTYEKIDFSKPQFVQASHKKEQVIEGLKIQGSFLDEPFAYLYISRTNHFGSSESIVVSPTQARELSGYLLNFARYGGTAKKGPFLQTAVEINEDRTSTDAVQRTLCVKRGKELISIGQQGEAQLYDNVVNLTLQQASQLRDYLNTQLNVEELT